MTEPEGFRQRLEQILSDLTPECVVGVGGLAMLCAVSALALVPGPGQAVAAGTLLAGIGGLGQNVLAGVLQRQYEALAGQPGADEQERLMGLAKALEGEIERDPKLRVEVGAFLDELDTFAIAEKVLRGNHALHAWLLVQIRGDVRRHRAELAKMQEQLASIEAKLDARLAPPGPPLQRPPRATHFTGRQAELDKLIDDLQPGQVVTLCGPGGIGKTALAAEAVWTLAPGDAPPQRFPDGVIFHTFYNHPRPPSPWKPSLAPTAKN